MPLPYPVVHPNPSLFESIGSFRTADFALLFAFTVGHFAIVSYGRGRYPSVRYFSSPSQFMKYHGASAGFIVSVLYSDMRLMGLLENSTEVAKYGVYPPNEDGTYPLRDPVGANWQAIKRMWSRVTN